MILSVCKDYAIGTTSNDLCVWNKHDLSNFRKLTTGHVVIMGRKTWESLPNKPLKNRTNVVIARTPITGVQCFTNLDEAIDYFTDGCDLVARDIWIIGGKHMFESAISRCDEVHLTHFNHDCGSDTINLSMEFDLELRTGFYVYNISDVLDDTQHTVGQFIVFRKTEKYLFTCGTERSIIDPYSR